MAVVSMNETRQGSADKDRDGRNYSRTFVVVLDDVTDGPLVARLAVPPYIGEVYKDADGDTLDTFVRCSSITPRQRNGTQLVYDVVAEYGARSDATETTYDDPVLRPPDLSFEGALFRKAVVKDLDGKAVVTSAGQPYDPPLEIDVSRSRLVVVQNEEYAPANPLETMAGKVFAYNNTINAATFLDAEPGKLRVRLRADRQFENDTYFWRVTYELDWHEEGWLSEGELLDSGTIERKPKDGGGFIFHDIIGGDGEKVGDPWLLDGGGEALSADDAAAEEWHYNQFRVYNSMPFVLIGLRI